MGGARAAPLGLWLLVVVTRYDYSAAAATASEFHLTGMTVGDEDAIFGGGFDGAAAAGGVGSGVVAKRRAAARAASCVVAGGRAR